MYMSAELIAILSCIVTLGVGMFAGFAWMVRRLDRVEDKLGSRIDGVEQKLGALTGEVTDLKIAVARFEGPPRHLIQSR
ncbi:hypothetical protein QF046_001448 [Microbacterium sp. W4I4]|uniref:hypothetical protein n=1 Tax=Microbacterium sp. W4I4 TaxID=3042295 RepID=UPI00277D3392|nr:hypothetical protein [Microbacterium sp. W4I4]MDQ0613807.1 hypothetical protein [Microbacterium sp. W4I4]